MRKHNLTGHLSADWSKEEIVGRICKCEKHCTIVAGTDNVR